MGKMQKELKQRLWQAREKGMALTLIALLFCAVNVLAAAPATTYGVIQRIAVPGEGGWDYLTADAASRRLYISHSTQVDVLDMDQNKVVGHIADTPGVHGIALSPNQGFTSNGKEGTLAIFDPQTLTVLSRVKVGDNPDAILYDPASRHVFTFNGRSQDMTAVDPATGKVVGRLPLGGGPEFAVADGKGMIYDNLEDKSQLLAINSKNLTIKNRWNLAPCEEPSSLAIDVAHRRLFAGCGNRMLAVVDADNGRVITTLPIGDHVDATVFDPETGMVFTSNGEGTLTVIHEDSPDAYHVVENVVTQKGARTVALDPKTHQLFLAAAHHGPTPAVTAENPHPRPAIVPGTFSILVVGKKGELP